MREGEQAAKRADTVRASRDLMNGPRTGGYNGWKPSCASSIASWLAANSGCVNPTGRRGTPRRPIGGYRERLLAKRQHVPNELDHRRAQYDQRRAQGWFTMYRPDDLRKGDQVLVSGIWRTIVQVNKQTVSVTTAVAECSDGWCGGVCFGPRYLRCATVAGRPERVGGWLSVGRRRRGGDGRASRAGSHQLGGGVFCRIMSVMSAPVAGPSVRPSMLWPVARWMLRVPGSGPMSGSPSGVMGRAPTHSCRRVVQSTPRR